jgi:hypothetical protein
MLGIAMGIVTELARMEGEARAAGVKRAILDEIQETSGCAVRGGVVARIFGDAGFRFAFLLPLILLRWRL